jgi:hypothetical protein
MRHSIEVQDCNSAARARVDGALDRREKTWYWLAREVDRRGFASASAILQWRSGHVDAIGCGLYLAIVDLLEIQADE